LKLDIPAILQASFKCLEDGFLNLKVSPPDIYKKYLSISKCLSNALQKNSGLLETKIILYSKLCSFLRAYLAKGNNLVLFLKQSL
tara:strand:- start:351 stop:605 length:255 start_codon:yes stop_codon:yes gene_type:complete